MPVGNILSFLEVLGIPFITLERLPLFCSMVHWVRCRGCSGAASVFMAIRIVARDILVGREVCTYGGSIARMSGARLLSSELASVVLVSMQCCFQVSFLLLRDQVLGEPECTVCLPRLPPFAPHTVLVLLDPVLGPRFVVNGYCGRRLIWAGCS